MDVGELVYIAELQTYAYTKYEPNEAIKTEMSTSGPTTCSREENARCSCEYVRFGFQKGFPGIFEDLSYGCPIRAKPGGRLESETMKDLGAVLTDEILNRLLVDMDMKYL